MFFFKYNNKSQFAAVSAPKEFPIEEFPRGELQIVSPVGGRAESGYRIL